MYGKVTFHGGSIIVAGDHSELYAWANRSGSRWPCSYLADCDLVAATFERESGDLVDLQVIRNGEDDEAIDLMADELTAWTDDVRANSPFSA